MCDRRNNVICYIGCSRSIYLVAIHSLRGDGQKRFPNLNGRVTVELCKTGLENRKNACFCLLIHPFYLF